MAEIIFKHGALSTKDVEVLVKVKIESALLS